MKFLIKTNKELLQIGRWDIDFHLPAEEIQKFPIERIVKVSDLAIVSDEKRDPTNKPDDVFTYIDISSVDVITGTIINEQELTGEEAPSRARKVIRAFDIIVSTVRATRGAIAVVPPHLHNQICSTGFTVLRCKEDINPYFLHFILRSEATKEQFRKFSTGSSYPAILDSDVLKTRIPNASTDEQDNIAMRIAFALSKRLEMIKKANHQYQEASNEIVNLLIDKVERKSAFTGFSILGHTTLEEIKKVKKEIKEREEAKNKEVQLSLVEEEAAEYKALKPKKYKKGDNNALPTMPPKA